MYACRTSEIDEMMTFENFYNDLLDLVKKYENQNIPLKIEQDLENNIVKIFGEKINSLARAKNGLNDIIELAYATAEHHPYWNVLYNSSEITNSVLDKWENSLSKNDLSDIDWSLKEIEQTLEKIKRKKSAHS